MTVKTYNKPTDYHMDVVSRFYIHQSNYPDNSIVRYTYSIKCSPSLYTVAVFTVKPKQGGIK